MQKKLLTVLACITSLVFAMALSTPIGAATSTDNFYFESFVADYYLSRDNNGESHLRVVEELVAVFPNFAQNHGITRAIPFTNNDGKNLTMNPRQQLKINVKRNGQTEPVARIEREDGYYLVYIGDTNEYVYGEQTYVLEYEFENVILTQSEDGKTWQELYWDTNGTDWRQRFNSVTARVHFEGDDIKDAFDGRTACYVGAYGESNTSRCQTKKLSDGYEFLAEKLRARENLTFVLGFNQDTFVVRETPVSYITLVPIIILLVIAAINIIAMLVLYSRTRANRDYYKKLFIKPEYLPPAGYTVAEAAKNYIGIITGGKPEVATLLELAVTHKIALIENDKVSASPFSQQSPWKIRVLSTDMTKDQVMVLQILAGSEVAMVAGMEITPISNYLSTSTTKIARSYQKYLDKQMVKKGLSEDKQDKNSQSKSKYAKLSNLANIIMLVWMFTGFMSFGFSASIIENDGASYYRYAIPVEAVAFIGITIFFIVTAIIMCLRNNILRYAPYTKKGLELSRYLDGLKLYIKMAEAERLQMLQSTKGVDTSHEGIAKLYEKLLPYACIFGLEKTWLADLSQYYSMKDVENPSWYIGTAAFSAHNFQKIMTSGSTFTSGRFSTSGTSGSSSSHSGFSGGGGHSGGGGGGGGGGGW